MFKMTKTTQALGALLFTTALTATSANASNGPTGPIVVDVDKLLAQQDATHVSLNGRDITGDFDVPPVIVNSTTFVELRGVFEPLGIKLHWYQPTRKVTGLLPDGGVIELTIGSVLAYLNGKPFTLSTSPFIAQGYNRTMVPLRFVAESKDADIGWNGNTRTVTIDTKRADEWSCGSHHGAPANAVTFQLDGSAALTWGKNTYSFGGGPLVEMSFNTFGVGGSLGMETCRGMVQGFGVESGMSVTGNLGGADSVAGGDASMSYGDVGVNTSGSSLTVNVGPTAGLVIKDKMQNKALSILESAQICGSATKASALRVIYKNGCAQFEGESYGFDGEIEVAAVLAYAEKSDWQTVEQIYGSAAHNLLKGEYDRQLGNNYLESPLGAYLCELDVGHVKLGCGAPRQNVIDYINEKYGDLLVRNRVGGQNKCDIFGNNCVYTLPKE